MTEFEKSFKEAAERSVLKLISDGQWIAPDYATRFKIPPDFLQSCWALVDVDMIKRKFVKRLESELADRIVNRLAEEISTDVKQILSVKERREDLRSLARGYIEKMAGG